MACILALCSFKSSSTFGHAKLRQMDDYAPTRTTAKSEQSKVCKGLSRFLIVCQRFCGGTKSCTIQEPLE